MPIIARPFQLRCPRCKELMDHFTEILFVSDYTIVVNGTCCNKSITSGPMNVLELFPTNKKDKNH
jgi:hypothetical protein